MGKVTKEKTDPGEESYFVRCSCHGHLVNVSAFVEDFGHGDFVYLTAYTTDPRYSWRTRIREAWRILREGLGGGSEVLLRAEEAIEVGQRMVELGKKVRGFEVEE